MISIEILNAEEVARSHAGKFSVALGKTLRIDFKERIEREMASRFATELASQGIEVNIKVTREIAEHVATPAVSQDEGNQLGDELVVTS